MHLYERFKDRFGSAGVVIGVIALVVALGGTALAAGALTSKQKKEVTKIAKKYAGKPGTNGTNGTNGAPGEKGAKGDTGATGPEGPTGPTGPVGPTGPEGSPWTAGGTLPSGKTETGVWSLGHAVELEPGVMGAYATISYSIPLSGSVTAHFIAGGTTTECPGSWIEPKAAPGNLCLYKRLGLNATYVTVDQSHAGGNALFTFSGEPAESLVYGSFAVTAP